MRKVAVYARVSTEHEEQLSALENQIQYYDEIISKHSDWELYDRYIDEGITGTSIHKRKNFMRMIRDAEQGCFDLIITREVSRFARNTVDTLQETRKLKKKGVEVYFTEDNIWTFKDDDGELKLTIMATLAQNESKKISQRVKAGQKITFQNGVFYGTGNILGYDKVGKDMVINPEQAEVVKLIFDLYLKDVGSRQIQYELERRGCKTATGLSKWSPQAILRILSNPFYCGTIVYRKSFIPDYLEQKPKKNNGEVEQIVVEGRHEPLISKEDFINVQNKLSRHLTHNLKEPTKRGKLPSTVWGDKLKCNCGSSMQKKRYHKNTKGEITWCFQCYGQIKTGSYNSRKKAGLSLDGICEIKIISEWKLKIITYVVFSQLLREKEEIIEEINNLLDMSLKDDGNNEKVDLEINSYNRRIDNLNKMNSKLLDAYLRETISEEAYTNKKRELEKEINDLKKSLKLLESEKTIPRLTLEEKIKQYKNLIKDNLNYKIEDMSDTLVDLLVDKIVVANDHFEWYIKFTDNIINIDDLFNKNKDENILIAKLAITNDDVNFYSKYDEELKRVKIKEPLLVDIYM